MVYFVGVLAVVLIVLLMFLFAWKCRNKIKSINLTCHGFNINFYK